MIRCKDLPGSNILNSFVIKFWATFTDDILKTNKHFINKILNDPSFFLGKVRDKIGFLEDAIARAVVLADLREDSVRVIQYKKPQGLFDEILGGASQARSLNNLEMGCDGDVHGV